MIIKENYVYIYILYVCMYTNASLCRIWMPSTFTLHGQLGPMPPSLTQHCEICWDPNAMRCLSARVSSPYLWQNPATLEWSLDYQKWFHQQPDDHSCRARRSWGVGAPGLELSFAKRCEEHHFFGGVEFVWRAKNHKLMLFNAVAICLCWLGYEISHFSSVRELDLCSC